MSEHRRGLAASDSIVFHPPDMTSCVRYYMPANPRSSGNKSRYAVKVGLMIVLMERVDGDGWSKP